MGYITNNNYKCLPSENKQNIVLGRIRIPYTFQKFATIITTTAWTFIGDAMTLFYIFLFPPSATGSHEHAVDVEVIWPPQISRDTMGRHVLFFHSFACRVHTYFVQHQLRAFIQYCDPPLSLWLFTATVRHLQQLLSVFRRCSNASVCHRMYAGSGLFVI